jgi:Ni,Fe-hydrogenase III small subunit/ferredoxin
MIQFWEIKKLFSKPKTLDYKKHGFLSGNARGIPIPVVTPMSNCTQCKKCEEICPTSAIKIQNKTQVQIDYSKCTQCGYCSKICPDQTMQNSQITHLYGFHKDEFIFSFHEKGVDTTYPKMPSQNVADFRTLTNEKGFTYREVAAGGNNSSEYELNASFNNVFDSESEGIRVVSSPKHGDAVVFTGPVSKHMEDPLQTAWDCTTSPKVLIALGTEATSGGLFKQGRLPQTPDFYILGDPPRPDVMIQGFRFLLGKLKNYNLRNIISDKLTLLKGLKHESLK